MAAVCMLSNVFPETFTRANHHHSQRRYKALVEKNGFSINVANGIAIKPFDPATDTAAASKSNTASSKSTPNARSGEKRKGRPPKDAEAKSKRAKTKHVPGMLLESRWARDIDCAQCLKVLLRR